MYRYKFDLFKKIRKYKNELRSLNNCSEFRTQFFINFFLLLYTIELNLYTFVLCQRFVIFKATTQKQIYLALARSFTKWLMEIRL